MVAITSRQGLDQPDAPLAPQRGEFGSFLPPVKGRGGRWPYTLFWLAFLFIGLAFLQLGLVRRAVTPMIVAPLSVWLLSAGSVAYLLHGRRQAGDHLLLPLTFFLSGLGLALTNRLAPAFITRQLFWLVIATGLLLAVTRLPRNLVWLRRYKFAWLGGGLLILATTLIWGVNPSGFGARLWLQFGGIFFQPSEPLKLCLVIFLAAYLADRRRQLVENPAYVGRLALPHPSYFGPMFIMWAISILLLIWQRDLGAALLFFGTFVGMLYAATGQRRYVWVGALLFIIAGFLGYYLFDVVQLRVEAFWNPWLDPAGRSFQIVQSLLAFASGGFLGQGLGQGLPTAIPVVHTDFVFAAIGEEYGLIGTLGILVCFALLVNRAFVIGMRAKSGFEQLLAIGIGVMLGLQILVITAGSLKLLPLTGVTLPLVSYGGSSLVTTFLMIGLLAFIAAEKTTDDGRRTTTHGLRSTSSHASHLTPHVSRFTIHLAQRQPYLNIAWAFLTGFLVIAGGLIFWQIALSPFLVVRDDNPRPVIEEQRIRRGRLLTADGIPVAETTINAEGLAERRYPYPSLASVTGYYSLRYGVGGTEATFDPVLRGTLDRTAEEIWLDGLLHRPLTGNDVTLTIDLPAQVAADVALGDREGAVVVMEIESGAILVMASHPTYDPNTLDETWEALREDERAPLINRVTQGLFPVGDLARLIGLIGLYESGATVPADPTTAPLREMLAPLGETGYHATAHQLALSRPLPGLRSQPGLLPDFDERGTVRDLAITPLHLARVVAALELDGRLIDPILSPATEGGSHQVLDPDVSRRVRGLLRQMDAQLIGLEGQATPEDTGKGSLSWFAGLAPAQTSPASWPAEASERTLIFDPTKITPTPSPTPLPAASDSQARYVVVAVVVTEDVTGSPAFRVAKAAVQTLLDERE